MRASFIRNIQQLDPLKKVRMDLRTRTVPADDALEYTPEPAQEVLDDVSVITKIARGRISTTSALVCKRFESSGHSADYDF